MTTKWGSIVFAGGGSRCFWQAGFWDTAGHQLSGSLHAVAAVSAGSAMATLCLADVVQDGVAHFKSLTADNERNFYPKKLLSNDPAFPHYQMYRGAILEILDPDALQRLRSGPDIRITMAALPAWLGPRSSVLLGMVGYELEKKLRHPVHPSAGRRIGFRNVVGRVADCETTDALADLILASSSTPPFTPVAQFGATTVLDGGLVDNVPVDVVEDAPGDTLILLSRRYKSLPSVPGRHYVQPSTDIPVSKWDYASPDGVQAAFDLGRRDGEAFLRGLERAA